MALEAFGCAVDRDGRVARLTESQVAGVLAAAKACNAGEPGAPPKGTPVGGIQPLFLELGGRPRAARAGDLLISLKIADELVGVRSIGPPLTNSEANTETEPIETLALMMTTCKRWLEAFDVPQPGLTPYLVRMGEIYTGRPASAHFLSGIYCVTTPLTFGDRVCRCMIERAEYSITAVPTPMPISGANVPISPFAAMAVAIAEIIAGWAIALALNPANPLAGLICSGSLDMATGKARFSRLEAIRQDAGVVQVLGRGLGCAVWCAHNYTDASEPGYPAVADKHFKSLTLNQFGAGVGCHQGTLDAGRVYSNEQLAIDIELNDLLQRHEAGLPGDCDMMLDALTEAGEDIGRDWLSDPSTAEHMREFQKPPDLLRPEAAQDILKRAQDKCQAALARYTPPELPGDKLTEIERLVDSARQELL